MEPMINIIGGGSPAASPTRDVASRESSRRRGDPSFFGGFLIPNSPSLI